MTYEEAAYLMIASEKSEGDIPTTPFTISENGVYNQPDEDGNYYDPITVEIEIPEPIKEAYTITANGVYNPGEIIWDPLTVDVPTEGSFSTMPLTPTEPIVYYAEDYNVDGFDPVYGQELYQKGVDDGQQSILDILNTAATDGDLTVSNVGLDTALQTVSLIGGISSIEGGDGGYTVTSASGYYLAAVNIPEIPRGGRFRFGLKKNGEWVNIFNSYLAGVGTASLKVTNLRYDPSNNHMYYTISGIFGDNENYYQEGSIKWPNNITPSTQFFSVGPSP